MSDNIFSNSSSEKSQDPREGNFERLETKEGKPEVREKITKKTSDHQERVVPTVEDLRTSIAASPPAEAPKRNLTEKEERTIEELVSLTIKNPDIEKGLEDANKELNKEIKRIKKQGKDYAYIIDEFHDRLVQKIQEMEFKLGG